MEKTKAAGIPALNVNDAVTPSAEHCVGNVQKGNGVSVANGFIANRPDGGKVAVIEGQPGVYGAGRRTAGFTETINANGKFTVVASVPANRSREEAFNAATTILQQYPDLIGSYANIDGMALGVWSRLSRPLASNPKAPSSALTAFLTPVPPSRRAI